MPQYVNVTLRELVEETLEALYRGSERPRQVILGSDALTSTSKNSLNLSVGVVAPTDRIEFGSEVVLVTARSQDASPTYTVQRGYMGTSAGVHETGSVGLVNPPYHRHEVIRWIRRAIDGLMNTELPYVETNTYQTVERGGFIELPGDTIEVLKVRHFDSSRNRISDVGGWRFEEDMPTAIVSTGQALRVHSGVTDADELIVTLRRPYRFAGQGEDASIQLPISGRDIPVLWAAAYGVSRREISRAELDKIEEWNQEQAIRAGVNLRMIRDLWGEVYRRVDEAKRTHRIPRTRVYRKMPKVW